MPTWLIFAGLVTNLMNTMMVCYNGNRQIPTYTHTQTHTHEHTYMKTHTQTHTHKHTHEHMNTHTQTHTHKLLEQKQLQETRQAQACGQHTPG